MIIFKNFFSFGLTFSAYDWVIGNSIKTTLLSAAGVQVAICLLSIPMCKFDVTTAQNEHPHPRG